MKQAEKTRDSESPPENHALGETTDQAPTAIEDAGALSFDAPARRRPWRGIAAFWGALTPICFALGVIPIILPTIVMALYRKRLDRKSWVIFALSAALSFVFSGVLIALAILRLLWEMLKFAAVAVGLAAP